MKTTVGSEMGKMASTEQRACAEMRCPGTFRAQHGKCRRPGQTATAQLESIWAAVLVYSGEAVGALPFGLALPGSSLPEMSASLGQPWRAALCGPKPAMLYPYYHGEFWK